MQRQVDPIAAYDRIAPEFGRISDERRAYLGAVERLVISQIPAGMHALLDVGAGDGSRSLRIIEAAGLRDYVLLEPSAEMRARWPPGTPCWPIPAEQLSSHNATFDVITCLWNVLGHISPRENRVEVLNQCARLLTVRGLLFLDLNHRYNASHYGPVAALMRAIHDRLLPSNQNGDVTSRWKINGAICETQGHVFTDPEVRRMSRDAGLSIKKVFSVDYRTGAIRRSKFMGSLLYVMQRLT